MSDIAPIIYFFTSAAAKLEVPSFLQIEVLPWIAKEVTGWDYFAPKPRGTQDPKQVLKVAFAFMPPVAETSCHTTVLQCVWPCRLSCIESGMWSTLEAAISLACRCWKGLLLRTKQYRRGN